MELTEQEKELALQASKDLFTKAEELGIKIYSQDQLDDITTKVRGTSEKRDKRTRTEVLKELGQTDESWDAYIKFQDSQKTDAQKNIDIIDSYKTKEKAWSSEKRTFEVNSLVKEYGIKGEVNTDDLVVMADSRVTDDVDFKTAFNGVLATYYPKTTKDNKTFQIGVTKKPNDGGGDTALDVGDKWLRKRTGN
jgi:hypothetical protein